MTNFTKVLVAEDDYLVCEEITRALKQKGFEVIGDANDGKEAVEMTCQLRPDVVVMDIKMPVLGGIAASRTIQKNCPTPIVILSAYDSDKLVDNATEAGVGAYITKPPQAEEIERAIKIALARHLDLMKIKLLYEQIKGKKEELQKAAQKIKELQGIIPICANCKKIRTDQGFWEQVEIYIEKHSKAKFSHGLCLECAKTLYPEIFKDEDSRGLQNG